MIDEGSLKVEMQNPRILSLHHLPRIGPTSTLHVHLGSQVIRGVWKHGKLDATGSEF